MNIAFFLTPKQEVTWVPAQATVREALDRMEAHRHSAVPLLDGAGHYVGTITEGDLLWHLQRASLPWREVAATTPVLAAARRMDNQPVRIDAEIEALIARAVDQSFVPVIDDRDVFVGIVRRRRIIEYCVERAGLRPVLQKPPAS
jgi:CBS domain-containing protein